MHTSKGGIMKKLFYILTLAFSFSACSAFMQDDPKTLNPEEVKVLEKLQRVKRGDIVELKNREFPVFVRSVNCDGKDLNRCAIYFGDGSHELHYQFFISAAQNIRAIHLYADDDWKAAAHKLIENQ